MEYEAVTKDGAAITKALIMIWERLGKPDDCSTSAGWAVMDNIVQVWTRCFPQEVADFHEGLKNELASERTAHEAVQANGGYIPITFPFRIYHMIKALLPAVDVRDKKFIKQFASRYPQFKSTNYRL